MSGFQSFHAMRALRTSGLPPTARQVMWAMILRANQAGVCWPGAGTIAKDTGLGLRAVREHRRVLSMIGWLEVVDQGVGRVTRYRICPQDFEAIPKLYMHLLRALRNEPVTKGNGCTTVTGDRGSGNPTPSVRGGVHLGQGRGDRGGAEVPTEAPIEDPKEEQSASADARSSAHQQQDPAPTVGKTPPPEKPDRKTSQPQGQLGFSEDKTTPTEEANASAAPKRPKAPDVYDEAIAYLRAVKLPQGPQGQKPGKLRVGSWKRKSGNGQVLAAMCKAMGRNALRVLKWACEEDTPGSRAEYIRWESGPRNGCWSIKTVASKGEHYLTTFVIDWEERQQGGERAQGGGVAFDRRRYRDHIYQAVQGSKNMGLHLRDVAKMPEDEAWRVHVVMKRVPDNAVRWCNRVMGRHQQDVDRAWREFEALLGKVTDEDIAQARVAHVRPPRRPRRAAGGR